MLSLLGVIFVVVTLVPSSATASWELTDDQSKELASKFEELSNEIKPLEDPELISVLSEVLNEKLNLEQLNIDTELLDLSDVRFNGDSDNNYVATILVVSDNYNPLSNVSVFFK